MSKREVLALKGVAIILMFWHHFIGCVSMIADGNSYISCFGRFDQLMGSGAKICIPLFTFASGVGMYYSYLMEGKTYKSIWKRIVKFLITYWTMLVIVAIPYLAFTGNLVITKRHILVNLFALLHDDKMLYLSLSWYVKVYLEIMLVLPIVKFLEEKIKNRLVKMIIFVAIPIGLTYILPDYEANFVGVLYFVESSVRLLCLWFPVFYLGVFIAKNNILIKKEIGNRITRVTFDIVAILTMVFSVYMRSIFRNGGFSDVIITFVFVLAFDFIYNKSHIKLLENINVFLGKYSFQLWLMSGMLFLNTVEFQWIVYLPKISVLVLCWSMIILLPVSMLMNWISGKICSVLL